MTELEKIAYAKTFMDKLANGINPLDDSPVADGDLVNNVRMSRCFFFVSDVLRQVIDNGGVEQKKKKLKKSERRPFSITPEQRECFEVSPHPISATTLAKNINSLVKDVGEKTMQGISQKKIRQWLINGGMIEQREWEPGCPRLLPTKDGEEIGLVVQIWENYGRISPVVFFTPKAQSFVLDNVEAVAATEEYKKSFTAYVAEPTEE